MTPHYRPSGPMNWLLDKLTASPRWSLVGTVSPEERSLVVLSELIQNKLLNNAELIRVEPAAQKANRFRTGFLRKLNARQKQAKILAGSDLNIHARDVLCREQNLVSVLKKSLDSCSTDLIIDISAMPKRFFFPLITLAIESGKHNNIVVTYTPPEQYGDTLAEDPLPWEPLPMYGATPSTMAERLRLIIAVGYQSLRMNEIVGVLLSKLENVELLLPFPSVHPGFTKNWEFVLQVQEQWGRLTSESIKRIPTTNVSLAFDHILASTNNGTNRSVLAPFGPKPISLAMCLYGVACREHGIPLEIGYTQPQVYSDKYSLGVATIDGETAINAYCIRIGGRNLYGLSGATN